MENHQGYIKSLEKKENPEKFFEDNDHYINIEWSFIPMLAILTGKNGMGKSTILKMITYYFNRHQKEYNEENDKYLNYYFKLKNGLKHENILISLIHFDNNIIDLRSRDYTDPDYYKRLRAEPNNKEINFANKLKTLDINIIKETSISSIINSKEDESKLIDKLKENLGQDKFINFNLLKENQFNENIKWSKCFPKIATNEDRINILSTILEFKNYKFQPIKEIGNIKDMLFQNTTKLNCLNQMLTKSEFPHLIDIQIKSKLFLIDMNKISTAISDLNDDARILLRNILRNILKPFTNTETTCEIIKKVDSLILTNLFSLYELESMFIPTVGEIITDYIIKYYNSIAITNNEFLTTVLSSNLLTLSQLNAKLKENGFNYEIYLEIYFDFMFTSDSKLNPFNEGKLISLETLSNGEQIILLSKIWDYLSNSNSNGIITDKNQVLLLDEPDAHMHPSAIFKLVEAVQNFVNKFKVQVIMTTHNPLTVSYFNENNVFLLYGSNELKISSKISNHDIINNLTSQLVLIETPNKTLFVEGKDALFYQKINKILNNKKFYKIAYPIHLNIRPLHKGTQNCCSIIQLITFLRNDTKIYGLVDDDGNASCENIKYLKNLFYLERYSVENYFLDPINFYFYLKSTKRTLTEPLKAFKNSVEEKIDLRYKNWSLNQIIETIYNNSFDATKCVQVLQIIINTTADEFKRILLKDVSLFFQLKIQFENFFGFKTNIASDKNLIDYYNQLRVYSESTPISNIINDLELKAKQYTDADISNIVAELKSLEFRNNFLKNKSNGEQINLEDIEDYALHFLNYDLKKCLNINDICENKLFYLNESISNEYGTNLEDYFIVKKNSKDKHQKDKIKTWLIDFKNSKTNLNELSQKLSEMLFKNKKTVYINKQKLDYPSIFINLRGHNLQNNIYTKVFEHFSFKHYLNEFINLDDDNVMFIPDELIQIFRNLLNNIVVLSLDSFHYQVFNSNENWFVKFTKNDLTYLDDLEFNKAAYELNGKANFGYYIFNDKLINKKEKSLFERLGLDLSAPNDQLIYFARNIVYETEKDFEILNYNDFKESKKDLIDFCLNKINDFKIKEINEDNIDIIQIDKPWFIKFTYCETYKSYSLFKEVVHDLEKQAHFGICFVTKVSEDRIIQKFGLKNFKKKCTNICFYSNDNSEDMAIDEYNFETKEDLLEFCKKRNSENQHLSRII